MTNEELQAKLYEAEYILGVIAGYVGMDINAPKTTKEYIDAIKKCIAPTDEYKQKYDELLGKYISLVDSLQHKDNNPNIPLPPYYPSYPVQPIYPPYVTYPIITSNDKTET